MTAATSIAFKLDNLISDRAALHYQYAGQLQPQQAYVYVSEAGEVSADYDGNIGGGMPAHIWNKRTLSMRVSSQTDARALAAHLQSAPIVALLERIVAGHSIEWDGSNHRGRLSSDAQDAFDDLEGALLFWSEDTDNQVHIWSAYDFVSAGGQNGLNDVWPDGVQLQQAVEQIQRDAADVNAIVNGDVRAELLAWAKRDLDEGNDMDDAKIQALQAEGLIVDAADTDAGK